ncbi:pimeloyl-ACP methyl ester carboxylesterase [Bacillus tianshenii]|uniref:Pimeloyl-ACP methyl ester carboxylesterase n=1 Tax=Sutcliffiella tianshenii TaxID=1463404 RepID=A0ABS2NVZ6_9BACI|nr:alpha/beta hydrolase [Bacillus tianshenii]MBM7618835.1 pimeloyl-ACP methyl ester carboxylesterase [Bacillus tianshenii]
MFKKRDFVIPETGVDEVRSIRIGNMDQTVLIQSYDISNPVLLFIHGGPSMPLPGVSSRGKDYTIVTNTRELVKHYTVVFWDQRGTGKSYQKNISQETMNFEQFLQDAIEVVDYVRKEFGKEKIHIAAHSYGTLIGMYLVNRHPEKFHSYTGFSQIISWTENDKSCYEWAKNEAEKRNDNKALKELKAVGEPPYIDSYKQWAVIRKYQMKYSSMIYSDDQIKHPGLLKISLGMYFSEDYSFTDLVNTFYRGFKLIYTDDFIKNIPTINLLKEVKGLKVPTTFIHGEKDVHVPFGLLEEFLKGLPNNQLAECVLLPNSSHLFHPIDTKAIEGILIEKLRAKELSL